MYRSKNRIIKVINCHNIIGVVYTFLSINLPTLLNVNIYLKKKNIFEIIIFRFDLLNTKFIFFFIYFAIYGWGNVQRVLESKTNLTKFARFYLMILSHTSIIIYHYQRCCRIPLLQPQLILTSSTSTTTQLLPLLLLLQPLLSLPLPLPLLLLLLLLRLLLLSCCLQLIACHPYKHVRKAIFVYTSTLVSTVIISRCFLFCVDGNATPRNNKTLYIM